MGLRELALKHEAADAMRRLDIVMADADDYAPDDPGAKIRSDQAKELTADAQRFMSRKMWEAAKGAAENAIRIMGGN